MSLSRADATAALHDADLVENRSALLRGYKSASPHLIIWGAVWAVGYTASYLAPAAGNGVWLALMVAGPAADIVAGRMDGKGGLSAAAMLTLGAIFGGLIVGTVAIMQPHDPRQLAAFIPLVVAAGYGILGALGAPRMLVIAAAIAALTLLGFFSLGALFTPWMAVVGGGGLVLGGLWLRQV